MTEARRAPQAQQAACAVATCPLLRHAWLAATPVAVYLLLALPPVVSTGQPRGDLLLSVAVTLVFTALAVAFAAQAARLRLGWPAEVGGALLAGGVWYALTWAATTGDLPRLYLAPAASVLFIVLCLLAGRLLSRLLRDANLLLPVCLVALIADFFTVYFGPTGKALEHAPKLVEKLSVGLPQAGSATGAAGAAGLAMLATMGLGDFIFLALFLTAAARFGFALRRGSALIAGLVCLGLLAYFALPLMDVNLPGLPLLPFITVGFLAAYWRRFHLSRTEKVALVWGVLLLAAILLGAGWLMRG